MARPPRKQKPRNPYYVYLATDPRPSRPGFGTLEEWRAACKAANFEPLHVADFQPPVALVSSGNATAMAHWLRWAAFKQLLSADVVLADFSGPPQIDISPIVAHMVAVANTAHVPVVALMPDEMPHDSAKNDIATAHLLLGPHDLLVFGNLADALQMIAEEIAARRIHRRIPPSWTDNWLIHQRSA